jgi:predicted transcriptional regulator
MANNYRNPKNPDHQRNLEWLKLSKAGKTHQEIANKYGVERSTVSHALALLDKQALERSLAYRNSMTNKTISDNEKLFNELLKAIEESKNLPPEVHETEYFNKKIGKYVKGQKTTITKKQIADIQAIKTAGSILDRRMKLLGFKNELENKTSKDLPEDEFLQKINNIETALQQASNLYPDV